MDADLSQTICVFLRKSAAENDINGWPDWSATFRRW
jgi:hypothetical protein